MPTQSILEGEPLARWSLVRSTSIRDAEAGGGKLLSPHSLHLIDAPSHFDAHVNGLSLGGVSLYYMNYGAALSVSAGPMNNHYAVCMPVRGGFALRQGRARFESYAGRGAAVVSPTWPLSMEWTPNLAMYCLKIDRLVLVALAASLNIEPGEAIEFAPEVTCPHVLESLRGCVRLTELASARLRAGQRMPSALAARIRDQFLVTFLVGQSNTAIDVLSDNATIADQGALAHALDIIAARPESATPTTVAKQVGVSLRSLELHFQRTMGTTPHAHIRRSRLQRARQDLLGVDADTGRTVAGVACRWGFSNFGRFAKEYHSEFGERPSDTLKCSVTANQQ